MKTGECESTLVERMAIMDCRLVGQIRLTRSRPDPTFYTIDGEKDRVIAFRMLQNFPFIQTPFTHCGLFLISTIPMMFYTLLL